jgi:hypothetical protein
VLSLYGESDHSRDDQLIGSQFVEEQGHAGVFPMCGRCFEERQPNANGFKEPFDLSGVAHKILGIPRPQVALPSKKKRAKP